MEAHSAVSSAFIEAEAPSRPRHRVLFVGTDPTEFRNLRSFLAAQGFEPLHAQTADAGAREGGPLDAVVIDLSEPGAFYDRLRQTHPDTEIILTRRVAMSWTLAAMNQQNVDYLSTTADPQVVLARLRRAMQYRAARDEAARLRAYVSEIGGFGELVGTSPAMIALYELIERAGRTSSSVLITGESGSGKELIARALHKRSKRAAGAFVALNCSAVPDTLLESELFGHVKGAFTDARAARSGLFAKAHGGTLFLDEIGDMPLTLQPKLLRVLQEKTIRPLGDDVERAVDVRVIAATRTNLEQAVADGAFREDLYYRIQVIHVQVPPLRERPTDIPLLWQRFIESNSIALSKPVYGVSRAAADLLLAYGWPGNVRELQNYIERAVALTRYDELQVEDLPPKIRNFEPSHVLVVSNTPSDLITLDEVERRYIIQVMARVEGNKREAARVLGIDRKTLYRKLARYGLESS